jgi:hypothetical protein
VTDGKRFYGAKSMSEYRAFAGRDASRLFVTGMLRRTAPCCSLRLAPGMPPISSPIVFPSAQANGTQNLIKIFTSSPALATAT